MSGWSRDFTATQNEHRYACLSEAETSQPHKMSPSSKVPLLFLSDFNPLNPELNPICYLLALLAHHFLHVSRKRVKSLTIILRITNRCHFFCNISLLYVSTLHVSGLYQPIIRGIPSCCYLLPLGSCGAWHMSACVWVYRCSRTRTYAKHHMNQVATSNSWEYPWWWADRGPKHVG